MRMLGDYIYSLRSPTEREEGDDLRGGLSVVFHNLQRGQVGSCAHMSVLLAGFWRSLGGHTRIIRWATAEGATGHVAVELYSTTYSRWMYYDMNLNGFGADNDGIPLSIAALRSNLLTGENLVPVVNPVAHEWTVNDFRAVLVAYPVEWYVLNNAMSYFEPSHRFGRLNRLYPMLNALPRPLDRVADNLVGARESPPGRGRQDPDRRLTVFRRSEVAGRLPACSDRVLLGHAVTGATPRRPDARRRLRLTLTRHRRPFRRRSHHSAERQTANGSIHHGERIG